MVKNSIILFTFTLLSFLVSSCGGGGGSSSSGGDPIVDTGGDTGSTVDDVSKQLILLSGKTFDLSSGAPIANATITSKNGTAQTDENGSFVIEVAEDEQVLSVNAGGYSSNQKSISGIGTSGYLEVSLKSSVPVSLDLLISVSSSGKKSGKKNKDENLATLNIVNVDGVTEKHIIPGKLLTADGNMLEPLAAFELILVDQNQAIIKDVPAGFSYSPLVPIPSVLQDYFKEEAAKGAGVVPFWIYNETTESWEQDPNNSQGSVVVVDDVAYFSAVTTKVGWFGFFRVIEKLSCVQGKVIDGLGKGLPGIEVVAEGIDYQGFNQTRTDSTGLFKMFMKSGSAIKVYYLFGGQKLEEKTIQLQDFSHDHAGAPANSFCQPVGPSDKNSAVYITHPELINNVPPSGYEDEASTSFPLLLNLSPLDLKGKVVDSSGNPIENANIKTSLGLGANTDATGNYSFKLLNVSVGSIDIKASAMINGLFVIGETSLSLTGLTGEATASNIVLDSSSIIKYKGVITRPGNIPVPGAIVNLESGQSTLTDAAGAYKMYVNDSSLSNSGTASTSSFLSSPILVKAVVRDPNTNENFLCVGRSLTGNTIEEIAGEKTVTIDLVICKGSAPVVAQVEGLVKDFLGNVLADVEVTPNIDGKVLVNQIKKTDASGAYKFDIPAEKGSSYTLGLLAKRSIYQQIVTSNKSVPVSFTGNSDEQAFELDSLWNFVSEDTSKANSLGFGEKWMTSSKGPQFIILPTGSIRFSGAPSKELLVLESKFFADTSLLIDVVSPSSTDSSVLVKIDDIQMDTPQLPTTFFGTVKVNGETRQGVKVKALGISAPESSTDSSGVFKMKILPGSFFNPGFFLGNVPLNATVVGQLSSGGTVDYGVVETTLTTPQPFIVSSSVVNPTGQLLPKALLNSGSFTLNLKVRGVFTAPTISFADSLVVAGSSSTSGTELSQSFTYPTDKAGLFEVKFSVKEGTSDSINGAFFLSVSSDNKAPVITKIESTSEKIGQSDSVGVSLQGFAFDPEGSTLTYSWALGTSSVNTGVTLENSTSATVIVKTSGANAGAILLELTVKDAAGASVKGSKKIDIIKLPPVISAFSASPSDTIAENQEVTITIDANDPAGGATKVATILWGDGTPIEVKDAAALALANSNAKKEKETHVFKHTFLKEGTYGVSVLVVGSTGKALVAKKTISVIKSYEAPKLSNKAVSLPEDGSVIVDLLPLIINSKATGKYVFKIVVGAKNGNAKITNGKLEYKPFPNFNGIDALQLLVNDGFSDSNKGTIDFTITPVDDNPTITPDLINIDVPSGSNWVFTSDKIFDPDKNNNFTYKISNFSGYGSSTSVGDKLTYAANGAALTKDATASFSFKANDGQGDSNSVQVRVKVIAPTIDIVASPVAFSGTKDTQTTYNMAPFITGLVAGDVATIEIVNDTTPPQFSTSGKLLTFKPLAGQTGLVSVQYFVKKLTTNGVKSSNLATLTVDVKAPPSTFAISSVPSVTATRAQLYSYKILVSNPGGPVTYAALNKPTWLTLVGSTLQGTPSVSDFGPHSVKISATSNGIIREQLFSITVASSNAVPVLTTINPVGLTEEGSTTVTVVFTDADIDDKLFQITAISSDAGVLVGPVNGLTSGATFNLRGATNFVGNSTITVKVQDQAGGIATTTFLCTVTNLNDPPVLVTISNQAIQTNGTGSVAVLFTDPDGTAGLTWSATSSTPNIIISPLSGTTTGANLILTSTANFTGAGTVQVSVTDTFFTVKQSFLVEFGDVNDPPVLTAPATVNGSEDTMIVISSVSFTDPDASSSNLKVLVNATNGLVSLSNTTGITMVTGSASGSTSMIFTGQMTDLNGALGSLAYHPFPNFFGNSNVNIEVDDLGFTGIGGPKKATKNVQVNVANVNDAPFVGNFPTVFMNQEGTGSVMLNVSDIDTFDTYTWSVSSNTSEIIVTPAGGTGSGTSSFSLSILGATGFYGTSSVSVTVTDSGTSVLSNFYVNVMISNQAPTISSSGTVSVLENRTLNLVEDVYVDDVDAGAGILNVKLTVSHGLLSIDGTNGVNFIVSAGQNSPYIEFEGNLSQINDALLNMYYEPFDFFNGLDQLLIVVDDKGNTGPGGPKVSNDSMDIQVIAVNDAPKIAVVQNYVTAMAGHTISMPSIVVFDEESGPNDIQAILKVEDGLLSVTNTGGLTSFTGSGSSSIQMVGSYSGINVALSTLTYTNSATMSTMDMLQIDVDDLGNSGGTSAVSDELIVINIVKPIFVDVDASGGNDGSTWADAYVSLENALSMVGSDSSSMIWVAAGVYAPQNHQQVVSFSINSHVELYGGFSGSETSLEERNPKINVTVLEGDVMPTDGSRSTNSHHVVNVLPLGAGSLIDGFTIQGGNASIGGANPNGGGLLVINSAIRIRQCIFKDNYAGSPGVDGNGGGVYSENSVLDISDSFFLGNKAYGNGGGLYIENGKCMVQNCVFEGNDAVEIIAVNGGESVSQVATPTIGIGGAITNNGTESMFSYLTITNNSSSNDGNGFFNSGTGSCNLEGSIIYGNGSSDVATYGALNISNCIVGNSFNGGTTVLNTDPNFANIGDLDGADNILGTPDDGLRLTSASIGAGAVNVQTGLVRASFDITGNARTLFPDMGAYEYDTASKVVYVNESAAGNGDGTTWGLAFNSLHMALTSLGSNDVGAEVWVAEGDYFAGKKGLDANRLDTFMVPYGVSIFGGFAPGDSNRSVRDTKLHSTRLHGEQGFRGYEDDVYHVVTMNGPSMIDGLMIEGGNADDTSGSHSIGGGVLAENGGAVIQSCHIQDSMSYDYGGGAYVINGTVENTRFIFCQTSNGGGGLKASQTIVRNNSFIKCDSFSYGGGLYIINTTHITEDNFFANCFSIDGGAVYTYNAPLVRNAFLGNISSSYGGAIYSSSTMVHENLILYCYSMGEGDGVAYINTDFFMNLFIGIPQGREIYAVPQ